MLATPWPFCKPWPEHLLPLAAHLCVSNYSTAATEEILAYARTSGHLPPPDWFDTPADYAEAFTFLPSPVSGGSDEARLDDAEWHRRMAELPDEY